MTLPIKTSNFLIIVFFFNIKTSHEGEANSLWVCSGEFVNKGFERQTTNSREIPCLSRVTVKRCVVSDIALQLLAGDLRRFCRENCVVLR